MEYLKRVLGIEVLYENKALEHLPNFISTRYDSQKVSLSGVNCQVKMYKRGCGRFSGPPMMQSIRVAYDIESD